jgi:hypothetical protein
VVASGSLSSDGNRRVIGQDNDRHLWYRFGPTGGVPIVTKARSSVGNAWWVTFSVAMTKPFRGSPFRVRVFS